MWTRAEDMIDRIYFGKGLETEASKVELSTNQEKSLVMYTVLHTYTAGAPGLLYRERGWLAPWRQLIGTTAFIKYNHASGQHVVYRTHADGQLHRYYIGTE